MAAQTDTSELKKDGENLRELFRNQARRPFVLELAGTPKAGKTTVLGILRDFFKDCGIRVSLMKERASECPIPMKGHFFFNAWTATTMLSQVLGQLDSEIDILMLDRGFFDSLVWLELQDKRGQLTPDEKEAFQRFMLLPRWRGLTDLTVLLLADPAVAMERENVARLIRRTGSIMHEDFLGPYNDTLKEIADRHQADFQIIQVDSSAAPNALRSAEDLLSQVIPVMRDWVDPKIRALPHEVVSERFGGQQTVGRDDAATWLAEHESALVTLPRSRLEKDAKFVQIVAAAVQSHDGKYLVLQRSADDEKARRYGVLKVWQGCHVAENGEGSLLEQAKKQLKRRVREDLHLSTVGDPRFLGAVWSDRDDETQHLGLVFEVEIVDSEIAKSLSKKEFRRGTRAPPLRSQFYTADELLEKADLESWSGSLLRDILKDSK